MIGALLSYFEVRNHKEIPAEKIVKLQLNPIPDVVDPEAMKNFNSWVVGDLIADGLFKLGEGFVIEPVLASGMSWQEDGHVLNIELRPSYFSDGSPLTAEDVIRTLENCSLNADKIGIFTFKEIYGYEDFIKNPKSGLKGIQAISKYQLQIRLKKKSGLLLTDLTNNSCYVVKPNTEGEFDLLKGAIGAGPYKIDSQSHEELILVKNPYYSSNLKSPDKILISANAQHKFDFFIKDENVQNDENYRKYEYSPLNSMQLLFNCKKGPLSNTTVRKALYLGFDRKPFIEHLKWLRETTSVCTRAIICIYLSFIKVFLR